MSIKLSDLAADLQADVPARNSLPSADQYQRCVEESVADFGRRVGRRKIETLSIVSGTATYSLPTDFVKLVKLESLEFPDGVMHTAAGLVPMSSSRARETWTIANGQITFFPTPAYTVDRYLHYTAGWVLDAQSEYAELEQTQAETILHLAASKALTIQANKAAQEAWQYQIGDERVSKERLAAELREQAKQAKLAYDEAVKEFNAPTGVRASYPANAYE